MTLLLEWFSFSLSVFIVARLLPFVHVRSYNTAVIVAAVYGVLKYLLTWVLVLLTLPLMLLTLGLFLVVINAFLLWVTDKLMDGFQIEGCLGTILTSVLISVLDLVLRVFIPGI
jgi:putative membrane protein